MRSPIKIIKIDGSHSYLRSKLRFFNGIFYCFSLDIRGGKMLTEISVWTLRGKKFKLLHITTNDILRTKGNVSNNLNLLTFS